MSRASERWQDRRLDDLDRRVAALEGEVSVRQDHREILRNLLELQGDVDRVLELLEPKGSVLINVGAVSEVN